VVVGEEDARAGRAEFVPTGGRAGVRPYRSLPYPDPDTVTPEPSHGPIAGALLDRFSQTIQTDVGFGVPVFKQIRDASLASHQADKAVAIAGVGIQTGQNFGCNENGRSF